MSRPNNSADRPVHPGRILRRMMEAKGWTQDEVATITGSSRQTIYSIMAGRSNISPEMAVALAAAFGNTPEEWLQWDGLYRLSMADKDVSEVERLARIYEAAPIRDMQKRGWIEPTIDPVELESQLKTFFASDLIDGDISFPIAPRRTVKLPKLTSAEKAWCFRAKQLSETLIVDSFSTKKLDKAEKRLRELAAFPKEARHIAKVLAGCGIRFLIVEPIPNVKIDGATFWLKDGPVIAMSIRYDRIDGFWFTLMHEFAHVIHGDASVDADLVDGVKGIAVRLEEDGAERLANERASTSMIPAAELQSFIRRVGPLYQRERIVQFAHKTKIHPGIIVGQLQYRKEIGYSALREFLVKVREIVTSTALTDGWNQIVTPGA